jgi:hypothetical protein
VAAQPEADVKQNENVAASSILEFDSTEPTASNPGVLHCSKRFQGKSGDAQRFYFAIPTPNIVLGARANILRVFLMYDFDPGASIGKVLVFDGPNQLIETGVSRVVDGPGFDGVSDPTHDLEEGVNLDGSRKLRPFFRCLGRPSGPVQREGPRFVKRRVLHLNVGPAEVHVVYHLPAIDTCCANYLRRSALTYESHRNTLRILDPILGLGTHPVC